MWDEIIGHKVNKEFLARLLEGKNSNAALLFYGPNGIGKNLMAKRLAKSLLCLNGAVEGDDCASCKAFATDNHPDFIEVKQVLTDKDIANNKTDPRNKKISIEQIKEMSKQALYAPTLSQRKVCIIDAAEFMTEEAKNSLLKLLEEPPAFWTFILVATDINRLLPTILSRVIKVRFDNLTEEEVKKILEDEGMEGAEVLAALAEGSPGRAQYIETLGALEVRTNVLDFLEMLPSKMIVNVIKELEWLEKIPKEQALLTLEMLMLILRDGLFLKAGAQGSIINKDTLAALERIFSSWDSAKIKKAFAAANDAYKAVGVDAGGKSTLEALFIQTNELWKETK